MKKQFSIVIAEDHNGCGSSLLDMQRRSSQLFTKSTYPCLDNLF